MLTPSQYYEAIQVIERLHRRSLDVLQMELDVKGIQDINPVQCMILYNIGSDELTVGELTIRGYYLGSNVSYNVKKLAEKDYIHQEQSVHDKRSIRVRLTDKGLKLRDVISAMFAKHVEKMKGPDLGQDKIAAATQTLKALERFWAGQSNFSAAPRDGEF